MSPKEDKDDERVNKKPKLLHLDEPSDHNDKLEEEKEASPPPSPRTPKPPSRCQQCIGCLQPRCGHCRPCLDHSPASTTATAATTASCCVFRPCLWQRVACLENLRMAARSVASQHGQHEPSSSPSSSSLQLTRLYQTVYGPDSAICIKLGTHAPIFSQPPQTNSKPATAARLLASPGAARCNRCYGCRGKDCHECEWCLALEEEEKDDEKNHSLLLSCCVFRPCITSSNEVIARQRKAALAVARSQPDNFSALFETLYGEYGIVGEKTRKEACATSLLANPLDPEALPSIIGKRVYCIWPDNQQWYWGQVQGSHLLGKKRLYEVMYEDGYKRTNVRREEFVTEDEYEPATPVVKVKKKDKKKAVAAQPVSTSSSRLQVGSRCYAKYSNGQWYWATVQHISGKGGTKSYSVQFDDGDSLRAVAPYWILSEEQYKEEFGDVGSSQSEFQYRTPAMLKQYCCGKCSFCTKEDCGRCQSCVTNKRQTSISKDMCLMKMCLDIPVEEKKQPLSGLLTGFSYYITEQKALTKYLRRKPAAHPDLKGLVIQDRNGRTFRTVKDACKAPDFALEALHAAEEELYMSVLGKTMTEEVVDHPLLGKGFHHCWRDCKGNLKVVHGKITRCQKSLLDKSLQFTVEPFEFFWKQLKTVGLLEQGVPKVFECIPEADAWGGYVSHMKSGGRECKLQAMELPFYRTYIVPEVSHVDRYTKDDIAVIVLIVQNHRLELEARKSGIPNAGLGLWVKCRCLFPSSKKNFELPTGHLLDLGVYAPLTANDCKNDNIAVLKNFVFSWKCEAWCWGSAAPAIGSIYDITDDQTGDLHETAARNPIVYANDTDGSSQPTIFALSDPEGSIHYFLGSACASQSPLSLPTDGKPVELKLDYGRRYESVRVRKGYPRVSGQELEIKREKVEQEDYETVREFFEMSVAEILEAVDFLKPIFDGFLALGDEKIKMIDRALIAALAMIGRLKEICTEFDNLVDDDDDSISVCTNGFSNLEENKIESKLASLISHLCALYPCGSHQLHARLVDDGVHQMVLMTILGLEDAAVLKKMNPAALRHRIESFLD